MGAPMKHDDWVDFFLDLLEAFVDASSREVMVFLLILSGLLLLVWWLQ